MSWLDVKKVDPQPVLRLLFFPLALLYYEAVLAIFTGTALWHKWGYVVAFSVAIGLVFHLVASAPSTAKWSKRVGVLLLVIPALWFITEALIWQSFRVFMSPFFMGENAEGVAGSYALRIGRIVLSGLPLFAVYALPSIAYLLLHKRVPYVRLHIGRALVVVLAIALTQGGALAVIRLDNRALVPDATYYGSGFLFDAAVPRFGLLSATRLDVMYALFGAPT
ncbi:MAG: hypothetical protein LBH11_05730, partial [Propionibacteriaceae bacterium]|nr:hypothetical protein [Propionibacteriaceae bacterium]